MTTAALFKNSPSSSTPSPGPVGTFNFPSTLFNEKVEGKGLVVLGVSMDERGWDAVRPFIAKQQVNYRMMVGEDKVAARFGGITALPTSFIIGRDGLVVSSHSGLVSRPAYEAALQFALSQPEKK